LVIFSKALVILAATAGSAVQFDALEFGSYRLEVAANGSRLCEVADFYHKT